MEWILIFAGWMHRSWISRTESLIDVYKRQVLQLLCVCMLAPIVEELVMRGLLYERLREFMKPKWAIFLGGVLFGVFHGNLVQGIYAAWCGWFLCWLMETYHSLKATVLSHMVSNLAVTLIVSTSLYENDMVFWIVTAAAAARCV